MWCVLTMTAAIWQGPSTQLKGSVAQAVKSMWKDLRPCILEKSLQSRIIWDVCRPFHRFILGTSTQCLNKRRWLPGKQLTLSHREEGKSLWKLMQFPRKDTCFPLQPVTTAPLPLSCILGGKIWSTDSWKQQEHCLQKLLQKNLIWINNEKKKILD